MTNARDYTLEKKEGSGGFIIPCKGKRTTEIPYTLRRGNRNIIQRKIQSQDRRSADNRNIIGTEVSVCPLCAGILSYRDSRLRPCKNLYGEITPYQLRRLRCSPCEILHTEIPDVIQPYKHYDSKTIQSVLSDESCASACSNPLMS